MLDFYDVRKGKTVKEILTVFFDWSNVSDRTIEKSTELLALHCNYIAPTAGDK